MRTAKNTMVCWTPPIETADGNGMIALVPWPDKAGLSDSYLMSGLAAYRHVHQGTFERRKLHCLILAVQLIIRDGMDPQQVHEAFLDLREYVDALADDVPGVAARRLRHE
jgi:hypothetical protein